VERHVLLPLQSPPLGWYTTPPSPLGACHPTSGFRPFEVHTPHHLEAPGLLPCKQPPCPAPLFWPPCCLCACQRPAWPLFSLAAQVARPKALLAPLARLWQVGAKTSPSGSSFRSEHLLYNRGGPSKATQRWMWCSQLVFGACDFECSQLVSAAGGII
jgi:hypothetical protein